MINSYAQMEFLRMLDEWIENRTVFYQETGDEGTLKLIESLKRTKRVIESLETES